MEVYRGEDGGAGVGTGVSRAGECRARLSRAGEVGSRLSRAGEVGSSLSRAGNRGAGVITGKVRSRG